MQIQEKKFRNFAGPEKKKQLIQNQSEIFQNWKIIFWIVLNHFELFSARILINLASKSM